MARSPKYKPKDQIGLWTLTEYIDGGGNGEVWRASDGNRQVALKILRNSDPSSEPYQRFRAEVEIQKKIGPHDGILPMLDSFVPENPSKANPAWLAMPEAQPVRSALTDDFTLEQVVNIVAQIAATLSDILAKHGASHRDIKPSNFYMYEDGAKVADFGLVDYPTKDEITGDVGWLGALHYTAPEMFNNPKGANAALADVYSLGKTLWVLAARQQWPLPGEHRVDIPAFTVSIYYPGHTKAKFLDRLVERMTRAQPEERPTMEEVASELRAWLKPDKEPLQPMDLSDLRDRIHAASLPSVRGAENLQRMINRAEATLMRAREHLGPIAARIQDAVATKVQFGPTTEYIDQYGEPATIGGPITVWRNGVAIQAASPDENPFYLRCEVGMELYKDGRLSMQGGYFVHNPPMWLEPIWPFGFVAQLASAEQDSDFQEMIHGLNENLRKAMELYAEGVEQRAGN